jgi:regulator of nucleoside diphosphate kinase
MAHRLQSNVPLSCIETFWWPQQRILLRKGGVVAWRNIIITREDYERLGALLTSQVVRCISGSDRPDELREELNRTQSSRKTNVVTMNSTLTFCDLDTCEMETYTLVYPDRGDIANRKLSVFAPIGTAVLGYRFGDEFSGL